MEKIEKDYKNSYKATEKELVSLAVYNVGFQKCSPLYQWGPGIRNHYLIHHIISGKGQLSSKLPTGRILQDSFYIFTMRGETILKARWK